MTAGPVLTGAHIEAQRYGLAVLAQSRERSGPLPHQAELDALAVKLRSSGVGALNRHLAGDDWSHKLALTHGEAASARAAVLAGGMIAALPGAPSVDGRPPPDPGTFREAHRLFDQLSVEALA